MNQKNETNPGDASERRRLAEARLKEKNKHCQSEDNADKKRTEADVQRLLHDLQVREMELEMQIEELQNQSVATKATLEKYTGLYDFAPVGYFTLDLEGAIIEANLAGASLLGVERSDLIRQPFELFISLADRPKFSEFIKNLFKTKVNSGCEIALLLDHGHPCYSQIEGRISKSGQECILAVIDITERKQADADRLILSKLESTGILASGIAHDFNNLLTVILLNLDLAESLLPPNEELSACIEEVRESSLLASGLTAQLLSFAKGSTSVLKLSALSGIIQESSRAAVSGSPARCEYKLSGNLWQANVDKILIGQVIRNIVLNAREAMPLEGGVISIQAENVVLGAHDKPHLPPGEYIKISISDRCGGIPKDFLPKIFDPYFSTKQRGDRKGMGLGLTICHSIVQKHRGAISVDSIPGVGTTFNIFLPAGKNLREEVKLAQYDEPPQSARILVMDDEESVRKLVAVSLKRMGHEVELAKEGRTAIECYKTAISQGRPYDAVILDLTVREGMGARETVRDLIKINPDVKAIVMSGHSIDPVILEYEQLGFKGALTKPFDIGKLQKIVSKVMAG